ncbi:ABC transporter substrate-binding protein [Microbacterium sediminis]|uniref:ABC transporter substrate-binding protein n=1 Tax=Microbacterium sediminis TaxID=904291 RepID=UPI001071D2C5|nr:ABC transporter substrate-binding protein [Microbacterium sediminis]QBR73014.1 ABC transporter substrate-binding protein [Microbacterium sediminis]
MASRRFTAPAVALVSLLALAGCAGASGDEGGNAPTGEPTPGGEAVFAVDSNFFGFDPNVTPAAQDARVLRQMFDSLLYLDESGELQPWLATEWSASDDGLSYDFTLRDDVTFWDGTPWNAEALCFNLNRIVDPAAGSIYAIGLVGPYESCEVTDEFSATVTLSAPFTAFLNNLTSPFLGMNSPTAAAAADPADYLINPVGSGPFVFESYTPQDRVVLTRNEDYAWAPGNAEHDGPAYLEKLTFQIIADATVRIGSVRSGQVQGIGNVPETEVAAIEGDPSMQFIAQQQSGAPYQLHLNATGVFGDPLVREAARAALDIDSAVQSLYLGTYERAWGPLSPTTIGYDDSLEGAFEFDPELAADLLDEAGWDLGADGVRTKDGQTLTIDYLENTPNREKRQDLATLFEANLEDVGFDVNVEFLATAEAQTTLQSGAYDIAGLSLVAVDPNVLYQMYDPRFIPTPGQTGFNMSHTDDPAVTELAAQSQSATGDERLSVVQQLQADVVENVRSIAVYVPTYTLALNGLEGLRFDPEGYPIFFDAYLAG